MADARTPLGDHKVLTAHPRHNFDDRTLTPGLAKERTVFTFDAASVVANRALRSDRGGVDQGITLRLLENDEQPSPTALNATSEILELLTDPISYYFEEVMEVDIPALPDGAPTRAIGRYRVTESCPSRSTPGLRHVKDVDYWRPSPHHLIQVRQTGLSLHSAIGNGFDHSPNYCLLDTSGHLPQKRLHGRSVRSSLRFPPISTTSAERRSTAKYRSIRRHADCTSRASMTLEPNSSLCGHSSSGSSPRCSFESGQKWPYSTFQTGGHPIVGYLASRAAEAGGPADVRKISMSGKSKVQRKKNAEKVLNAVALVCTVGAARPIPFFPFASKELAETAKSRRSSNGKIDDQLTLDAQRSTAIDWYLRGRSMIHLRDLTQPGSAAAHDLVAEVIGPKTQREVPEVDLLADLVWGTYHRTVLETAATVN